MSAILGARGLVMVALLIAAARLPEGLYARFTFAYQAGLFLSYLIASPLIVAGFRLRGSQGLGATWRRAALGGGLAAPLALVGVLALLPGVTVAVAVAAALYSALATGATIWMGQAHAHGYARTFAEWSLVGSAVFVVIAFAGTNIVTDLAGASISIALGPIGVIRRLRPRSASSEEVEVGRPSFSVFAWGLCYSVAFLGFLGTAVRTLPAGTADHLALGLTFLQAALVVPSQFAALMQPRLAALQDADSDRRFADIQYHLSLLMMLLGLGAAGIAVALGFGRWDVLGPLAATVVPLGFGLTGGFALLIRREVSMRLVIAPAAFALVLGLGVGALPGDRSAATLAWTWAAAAIVGAVAQVLAHGARPVGPGILRGIAVAAACLAVGAVNPLLATALAVATILASSAPMLNALSGAGRAIALHR